MQESNKTSLEQVFIHLNMRAIEAKIINELRFIITNETVQLANYRQAALFNISQLGKPILATASGLVSVAENSPYTVWLNDFAKSFDQTMPFEVLSFTAASPAFQEGWQEWLPEQLLIIALRDQYGKVMSMVLYARETEWTDQEINQLTHLHKTYSYCLSALRYSKKTFPQRLSGIFSIKYWILGVFTFTALMFVPVPLSTLAPAEVIALNAFSVAAPQEGVIQSFNVEPNMAVKKGDLLFSLNGVSVSNRLEVARKGLEIARAEALVAQQRAFDDIRGKAELASAIGRVREKEAELASVKALMSRIEVRAEREGIAIFTDINDWIGRPVQTGERVIQIANPEDAGLLMWLPVKDALNLDSGAPMKLFLHTDPLKPVQAKLNQTSYQSILSPDNVASYRLKGEFEDKANKPRIGLRGTARISGESSILGYYLFRRPIAAFREWSGL